MTKEQDAQFKMLTLVELHFNDNAAIWSSNILISDVKVALSAKIREILAAAAMQAKNSTGTTKKKAGLRGDLETKGFLVSSALQAYAGLHPDLEQFNKKMFMTKAGLKVLRENDLLVYIENLNATATGIIAALQPYGVTQATLDELMAARTDFLEIMGLPEEIVNIRKSATETITVLFHEAVALLEVHMDHLMASFSTTEPNFLKEYYHDRKIHRGGKRKMSLSITTLDATTKNPLANAKIEVVGHNIKRFSNQSGLNRVQNLKEGYYTLSVSLPGFVQQTIPFTVMSSQTTQVVISMQKILTRVPQQEEAEE